MSDIYGTTTPTAPIDLGGFDDSDGFAPVERAPFTPNYTPLAGTRILRHRLYADEGGVATATFAGTLNPDEVWTEGGTSGRMSVYAEVARNRDDSAPVQTTLRIALVPTGKRVPEDARRLGSRRGLHAYLLAAEVTPMPAPQADGDDADADIPAPTTA